MPATIDPDLLKQDLPVYVAKGMGQPLTDAERKDTAREAVLWLKRLAVGEVPGYNVKGAKDALLKAAGRGAERPGRRRWSRPDPQCPARAGPDRSR